MDDHERMLMVSFPLLVFLLSPLSSPSVAAPNSEQYVMNAMAAAITPTPADWTSNTECCKWSGVRCDSNTHVSEINLANRSLSGELPPLNSLSQLTSLSLQSNSFYGPLPSFTNLSLLQTLYLDSNNFSSIPPGAFEGLTSLHTLSLSHNNLTGSLPTSLNGSSVQKLWLHNQQLGLTGTIDVLSGMTEVTQVWLHGNRFTGGIPDLTGCNQLFDLQLGENKLTGIVPTSLLSLPSLKNVTLRNNFLQGPYPNFSPTIHASFGSANSFCRSISGDCDPQVSTLLEIARALGYPMKLAEAWTGNNACNQWIFVVCDSGRVITVNFAKQGFIGTISPAFSNLTYLRELYLNDNNLTGSIPESLSSLDQLRKIDLSNNNLSGKVPDFRSGVSVDTYGNVNIEIDVPLPSGSPGSGSHLSANRKAFGKNAKILIVVLVPTVSIVVLLVLVHAHKKRMRKRESQQDGDNWGNLMRITPDSPLRFTLKVLQIATNNFNVQKKLGEGGFGSVFEGSLSDGTKVGVKRLDHHGQGRKEFLAEVKTIGSIHHVNLVKMVGFCAEKLDRLLVYEHMSNGSLDKWIFNTCPIKSLAWDAKRKIILQIAKGLAYLHEECQKRIAHLDVKPQNVLLDNNFNAKLSDFGLAKLIDRDQSFVMTRMRGTRGYLAPEWLGGKITEKADIYSYGIVVLEVIFERRNFDCSHPDESTPLILLAKNKVNENKLFDDLLINECRQHMPQNREDVEKLVKLAVWCLHTEPNRRPSMSTVVNILEGVVSLEAICDCEYHLTILETEANPITQVSASVLSGPR